MLLTALEVAAVQNNDAEMLQAAHDFRNQLINGDVEDVPLRAATDLINDSSYGRHDAITLLIDQTNMSPVNRIPAVANLYGQNNNLTMEDLQREIAFRNLSLVNLLHTRHNPEGPTLQELINANDLRIKTLAQHSILDHKTYSVLQRNQRRPQMPYTIEDDIRVLEPYRDRIEGLRNMGAVKATKIRNILDILPPLQ